MSAAVTRLRQLLNQTQQQFAQTLGTAVTSVARYETSRNPSGPILVRLRDLTRSLSGMVAEDRPEVQRELLDLDDLFFSALVDEFPLHRQGLSLSMMCEAEKALGAIQDVILAETTPSGLRPKLQEVSDHLEEIFRYAYILDPMHVLLAEGTTAESVAEFLAPMVIHLPNVSNPTLENVKRGIEKLVREESKP